MAPPGFTERPRERAREVTIELLSDHTLPNILLGAFITATIQYAVDLVPLVFMLATGGTWICSIVIYAYVDQVRQAIEEAKRETLSDESDYRGIE